MGVSVSIQTKFLYKIVNNGDLLPQIIYAEFKDMFFEQGAFRYCNKGAIKNLKGDSIITIDFPLGQCVVKIYKKQFFTQDYLYDFFGSKYAYEETKEFNRVIKIPNN